MGVMRARTTALHAAAADCQDVGRGVAARLDGFQRRHTWMGFPVAVVYKFVDDQGGYLAALITYYGFLALFPLLLLLVSVLGYLLVGNPALQHALVGSALQQLPLIGPQLQQNISAIHGSRPAVILGILGALYGGLNVSVAIQTTLNRVWAVPRYARPNPLVSRLRGLVLFALIGIVVLITTALSAVGTAATDFLMTTPLSAGGSGIGTGVRIAAIAVAAIVNVAAFLIGFRVLTARDIRLADLCPAQSAPASPSRCSRPWARCSSAANSSAPHRSTACSDWFSDYWAGYTSRRSSWCSAPRSTQCGHDGSGPATYSPPSSTTPSRPPPTEPPTVPTPTPNATNPPTSSTPPTTTSPHPTTNPDQPSPRQA
jgi:uncharacterized BrkB/YihY/UPF0761 family membrane protein